MVEAELRLLDWRLMVEDVERRLERRAHLFLES